MKVLLLGSGHSYVNREPYCHSCITNEEYEYCVKTAQEAGTLVRLDMDSSVQPDVVATVYEEEWASKVKELYGDDFDIIIDEITSGRLNNLHYHQEAEKLLKPDGVFYGWLEHKKVRWFNTNHGLVLSCQ